MPDEYASIIKINGIEMPPPSEFDPEYNDYDSQSAGRSETMVMTRDIIRTDVRTVMCTWKLQTPEMRALIAVIKQPSVELSFFDLNQSAAVQYSTMTCYGEPTRKPKCLKWDPYNPERSWWSISIKFTEY